MLQFGIKNGLKLPHAVQIISDIDLLLESLTRKGGCHQGDPINNVSYYDKVRWGGITDVNVSQGPSTHFTIRRLQMWLRVIVQFNAIQSSQCQKGWLHFKSQLSLITKLTKGEMVTFESLVWDVFVRRNCWWMFTIFSKHWDETPSRRSQRITRCSPFR